jgi:exonuclease VII small subunit
MLPDFKNVPESPFVRVLKRLGANPRDRAMRVDRADLEGCIQEHVNAINLVEHLRQQLDKAKQEIKDIEAAAEELGVEVKETEDAQTE